MHKFARVYSRSMDFLIDRYMYFNENICDMKKLLSTLSILSILLVLNSCSDNRPDDLPVSRTATASKSFRLIAAAGNSAEGEVTFTLDDFAAIKEYAKWVKKGEAQASSFIQISGINASQEVELKNVTLTLERGNKNISLDPITDNDKLEATNVTRLRFMQDILDDILRRGNSTVILKYESTYDVTNPIELTISLNSLFSF